MLIGQNLLEMHAETKLVLNLAPGVDDSAQKVRRRGQALSSLLVEAKDAVMCMVQGLGWGSGKVERTTIRGQVSAALAISAIGSFIIE